MRSPLQNSTAKKTMIVLVLCLFITIRPACLAPVSTLNDPVRFESARIGTLINYGDPSDDFALKRCPKDNVLLQRLKNAGMPVICINKTFLYQTHFGSITMDANFYEDSNFGTFFNNSYQAVGEILSDWTDLILTEDLTDASKYESQLVTFQTKDNKPLLWSFMRVKTPHDSSGKPTRFYISLYVDSEAVLNMSRHPDILRQHFETFQKINKNQNQYGDVATLVNIGAYTNKFLVVFYAPKDCGKERNTDKFSFCWEPTPSLYAIDALEIKAINGSGASSGKHANSLHNSTTTSKNEMSSILPSSSITASVDDETPTLPLIWPLSVGASCLVALLVSLLYSCRKRCVRHSSSSQSCSDLQMANKGKCIEGILRPKEKSQPLTDYSDSLKPLNPKGGAATNHLDVTNEPTE